MKYHSYQGALCEFVDLKNGNQFGKKIEIKFLALALKAFILHYLILKDNKIYDNGILYSLSRDR